MPLNDLPPHVVLHTNVKLPSFPVEYDPTEPGEVSRVRDEGIMVDPGDVTLLCEPLQEDIIVVTPTVIPHWYGEFATTRQNPEPTPHR